MNGAFHIDAYSDALVVLGTAGIIVPLLRDLGFNPILAYLGAGAILGPLGLGSFVSAAPFLYWVTVVDAGNVAGIAELGVVFLLFLIGLELSVERLAALRRLVFGLGGAQVLLTAAVLAAVVHAAGQPVAVAILIGFNLAFSSTAIVMELLAGQGRLRSTAGRACFAILLAQDLAVIPTLVFVSILGHSERSLLDSLVTATWQSFAALLVIVGFGRLLVRPLFAMVARGGLRELFIAAVLFVIVGAGVVTHEAGMSMTLGAFVAGLLLAETEFRKAAEATVEPFKALLLGIFFFTIGMNIDFRELLREPGWLIAAVAALIAVKGGIVLGLARLFRLHWPASIETAMLLGPGGEFAFVGLGLAASLDLLGPRVVSFAVVVVAITMALNPLLAHLGRRLALRLAPPAAPDPALAVQPPAGEKHAIVVGYGRVGKVVGSLLTEHGVAQLAIDSDPVAVARDRRDGHRVYYGNATDPDFLRSCGLHDATGVIVTIDDHDAVDAIVAQVRAARADILIVVRARDADHARHLYAVGATDVVPETIEASLQLSEAALLGLGLPAGPVIASIHGKRDTFRQALQKAALSGRERGPAASSRTAQRSPPGSPTR